MSEYKDYGYKSNKGACAHSYLAGSLLRMLNKGKNKTLLDVGCGNGSMASFLIENGYTVYGTDASVTGIEQARKTHANRFFVQDLTKDELPSELSAINFDTIISTEVVEHLYDPRKYIAFCKNVLEKNGGGELILSTPYHGYLKNLVMAASGTLDNHFTALWDGGHIKFWSRKTLTQLLTEQGFKVTEFKGSGRIPYLWKSMFIKAII
jgi:2-polyprenyl-3-methyl-5-hydroxy-6-metoxy-1,4-benzoquinol methylase